MPALHCNTWFPSTVIYTENTNASQCGVVAKQTTGVAPQVRFTKLMWTVVPLSVSYAGILYIFSIGFVQLLKDTPTQEEYFPNVPAAMNSLLLDGVMPDQACSRLATSPPKQDAWIYRI